MAPDGSNRRRITNTTSDEVLPTWSPDGRWIDFDSTRDGNLELYVMSLESAAAIRLTDRPSSGDGVADWTGAA